MTRRNVLLVGWLGGALVALAIGGAALAGGASSSARGTIREPDGRFVEFNARGSGTNVTGHVKISFRPDEKVVEFFEVTCLNVVGGRAFIRAELSHVSPPSFTTPVQEVVLLLKDNEGMAARDRYSYSLATSAQPCLVPTSWDLFEQEFRGDVVVRDLDG